MRTDTCPSDITNLVRIDLDVSFIVVGIRRLDLSGLESDRCRNGFEY